MADNYTYIAKDADGTPKFGWDGEKWNPITPPSATNRAITSFAGLPEGTNIDPTTKDFYSGMGDLGTWLDAAGKAVKGLNPYAGHGQTVDTAISRLKQPGAANKISGAIQYLESGVPFAGSSAAKGQEQFTNKDYAGSAGSSLNALLTALGLAKASPAIAEKVAAIPETVRGGLQSAAGVGDTAVKLAQEKRVSELPKLRDENAQAIAEAKKQMEDAQAAVDKSNAEALAQHSKESADVHENNVRKLSEAKNNYQRTQEAVQRRESLVTQAEQARDQLAESLPKIREQETAVAKSLYPQIEAKADGAQLYSQIQDEVKKSLRGSEKVPTAIARILSEIEPEEKATGPRALTTKELEATKLIQRQPGYQAMSTADIRGALPNLGFTPREVDAILSVARPEAPVSSALTFDKLHGYYSELGRAMYGGDIPGDEFSAYKNIRENVIGKQMAAMAEAENKGDRFQAAQENWKRLENTFNNTSPVSRGGSPIARALAARDPITGKLRPEYVQDALSGDAEYRIANQMLKSYRIPTTTLDTMKNSMDQAAKLPKRVPEIARIQGLKKPPESPTLEEAPKVSAYPKVADTSTPFDPLQWRIGQIKRLAEQYSGASRFEATPTSYGVGRIPFRRSIARALANESFRNWLVKNPAAAKSLLSPALINLLLTPKPQQQQEGQ